VDFRGNQRARLRACHVRDARVGGTTDVWSLAPNDPHRQSGCEFGGVAGFPNFNSAGARVELVPTSPWSRICIMMLAADETSYLNLAW